MRFSTTTPNGEMPAKQQGKPACLNTFPPVGKRISDRESHLLTRTGTCPSATGPFHSTFLSCPGTTHGRLSSIPFHPLQICNVCGFGVPCGATACCASRQRPSPQSCWLNGSPIDLSTMTNTTRAEPVSLIAIRMASCSTVHWRPCALSSEFPPTSYLKKDSAKGSMK